MKSQLIIPKNCKAGFNLRKDTYTGKLAYIIYHDGKVWRKETSWEGWREKYIDTAEFAKNKEKAFRESVKAQTEYYYRIVEEHKKNPSNGWYADTAKLTLEQFLTRQGVTSLDTYQYSEYKHVNDISINPVEFENVPTEGFVLNKKVGGYSGGWDARQTYCRVWDPRGFEFEITVPNLLFILQETSSLKGKGLEGEFVYAWDGKDLVLLPTSCQEYKLSSSFTKLQQGKVAAKDLVAGYSYQTKKEDILTYLGKFEFFDDTRISNGVSFSKRFVFVDIKGNFVGLDSVSSLSKVTNETIVSNYAELVDKFSKSDLCGVTKDLKIESALFGPKSNSYSYYSRRSNDYAYRAYYKEEKPNTYRRYDFYPVVKEQRTNGWYGYEYITTGFNLKPISEISFIGGKLAEKKLTLGKSDETISLELANKLGFGELKVVLNSGKEVKLN